ncbi:hypothetical protein YS110_10395 [Acidovorax sp. YS12]|nr:hypothetical protein YS110_10395 [Acidovorax sp. YS12]
MDFFAFLGHLFNFAAPALFLALLLALGGRFFGPKGASALAWYAQAAINSVVGCAVLLAGLWWLGRDGRMLTYAALVLVCASCQWLLQRGWR